MAQQGYSPPDVEGEGVLSGAAWALSNSTSEEAMEVPRVGVIASTGVSDVSVEACDAWRRLRRGVAVGESSKLSSNSMDAASAPTAKPDTNR